MQYGRNGPKAIEVKWHGCRFRSQLEAKWAVAFEAMGIEWEYEPEGFVADGIWYKPDFLIAGLSGLGKGWTFVEVKGKMTDMDRRKIATLSKYFPIYVVGDVPFRHPFESQYRAFSHDTYFHSMSLYMMTIATIMGGAIGILKNGCPAIIPETASYRGDELATTVAFLAARYARFDHGEEPEEQAEFIDARRRILRLKSKSDTSEREADMPRLSEAWNKIQESTGTFSDIEPGGYVLVITKVEPIDRQQYARFYWDVAEGPSKGAYAQSQWPPSDIVSWKDTAYGMLKHKMHVLADSNPNFQPTVAFDNDDWQQFVGKRFGAVVRKRLYTAGPNSKNPGADREAVEIAGWFTPEQIAAHDYSDSLLQPRDQREQGAVRPGVGGGTVVTSVPDSFQPSSSEVYSEDIPF